MMKVVIFLAVVAIGVVCLGFYQEWFSAKSKPNDTGNEITLGVDQEKFKKDKEQFQKKAEARLKELDAELEKLNAKGKDATGDAKTQWDKDVVILKEKKEAARKRLGEIQEASADKWEETKSGMEAAFEDLKKGFESAATRFK